MEHPAAARYFAEEAVRLSTSDADAAPSKVILAAHSVGSLEAVVYSGSKGRTEAVLIAMQRTRVEYYTAIKRSKQRTSGSDPLDAATAQDCGDTFLQAGSSGAALEEYADALCALQWPTAVALERLTHQVESSNYLEPMLRAHMVIVANALHGRTTLLHVALRPPRVRARGRGQRRRARAHGGPRHEV
jgi:tRNA A37 threonylcarbamoyladenosine modification protein TsaB